MCLNDKPKSINVKILDSIYNSIKAIRIIENKKMHEIIEIALIEYIKKYKNERRKKNE